MAAKHARGGRSTQHPYDIQDGPAMNGLGQPLALPPTKVKDRCGLGKPTSAGAYRDGRYAPTAAVRSKVSFDPNQPPLPFA
jgi:hypothetical protein